MGTNNYYFDTSKIADVILKSAKLDNITSDYLELNEDIFLFYDYLPVLYKNEDDNEYLKTLFKALELSYKNSLYQFAYIQLHMLFMVSIYYMLLKVNTVSSDKMEDALYYMIKDKNRVKDFYGGSNTRDGELYFGSFACLSESDVFLLLKIAGIDSDLQGELKKLVEERNKYAHANGNITITSQSTMDDKISKYVNTLERVQNLLNPFITKLYKNTLSSPDFFDSENRPGYSDDVDQIKEEFIKKYALSFKDLNFCRKFDITKMSKLDGYSSIKSLHIILCDFYKSINRDESLESC